MEQRLLWWRFWLLLCLVLGLLFATASPGSSLDQAELLSELKEISMQFQTALTEAEKALDDLVMDLEVSETALRQSKAELRGLRAELQSLRLEVVRLKKVSAESETQVRELEQQLSLVRQRTEDLRKSFEDYRLRVQRLERQKKVWKTLSLIELVAILVGAVIVALR